MVDREKREFVADAIHSLVAGLVTNIEFEDSVLERGIPLLQDPSRYPDAVLGPVLEYAWCLYGDLRRYRLTGRNALAPEVRRDALRWVMFLRTDLEYEWPPCRFINLGDDTVWDYLTNVFTLGLFERRRLEEQYETFQRAGEVDVWPFLRRADYEAAYRLWCPVAA